MKKTVLSRTAMTNIPKQIRSITLLAMFLALMVLAVSGTYAEAGEQIAPQNTTSNNLSAGFDDLANGGEFDVYTWNIYGAFLGNKSPGFRDPSRLDGSHRARIGKALAKVIADKNAKAIIGLQEDWQSKWDCWGTFHTRKYVSGLTDRDWDIALDENLRTKWMSLPGDTRELASTEDLCQSIVLNYGPQNDGINLYSSFPFKEHPKTPQGTFFEVSEDRNKAAYDYYTREIKKVKIPSWHTTDLGYHVYRETFDILEYPGIGNLKCFACKGFMLVRVEIAPGVTVDVYNVHFGGDPRPAQAYQLISRIMDFSGGPNNPDRHAVILVGDTNMHWLPRDEFPDFNYYEIEGKWNALYRKCPDNETCDKVFKYDPIEYRRNECWFDENRCAFPDTVEWDQEIAWQFRESVGLQTACQQIDPDFSGNPFDPGHCIKNDDPEPPKNLGWWFPKSAVIDQIYYRSSATLSLEVIDYEVLGCWGGNKANCGRELPENKDPWLHSQYISDHGLVRARLKWSVNRPPTADADGPYVMPEGATISLDGTASWDPDGDVLSYAWDLDDNGSFETAGPMPSFSRPDGPAIFPVKLQVCDPAMLCHTDSSEVVVENVPPTVNAGADQIVYRYDIVNLAGTWTDPAEAYDDLYDWNWDLDGDSSADSSGSAIYNSTINESTSFALEGFYTLTFDVMDKDDGFDDDTVLIEVLNRPPYCTAVYPSIDTIWPPNHKFVAVDVLGVTDPEGDPIVITVDSIYQDEPVDTVGDGSFTPDGMGVGTSKAEVRAERTGVPDVPGNGRVYHISFTADDGHGGSCSATVYVGVPHDKKDTPVDDGALYDSTS